MDIDRHFLVMNIWAACNTGMCFNMSVCHGFVVPLPRNLLEHPFITMLAQQFFFFFGGGGGWGGGGGGGGGFPPYYGRVLVHTCCCDEQIIVIK